MVQRRLVIARVERRTTSLALSLTARKVGAFGNSDGWFATCPSIVRVRAHRCRLPSGRQRNRIHWAHDIEFFPSGSDVPAVQQRFRADVLSTSPVIKSVLPAEPALASPTANGKSAANSAAASLPMRRRRDAILRRLALIARIGWEYGRVADALMALERLREEFAI